MVSRTMSAAVAMIEALEAEGLSAEAIIRVLKAADRKSDRTNAERQARHRVKRASNAVTVTPDKGSNERDILTSKKLPPKANALDPKPKKHRLPADWEPAPFTFGTLAAQTVLRWQPGRMERELAKFRDHHAAAGTQWENWQAAWSKWVNNSDDFQRGRSGQPATHNIGKSAAAYAMLNPGDDPF